MSHLSSLPVLVLDADMVPCLTICRSLRQRGIEVDIACSEETAEKPLAAYSRRYRRLLHYPDPLHRPDDFRTWVQKQASSGDYSLVIPVTERTLIPIARHPDTTAIMERVAVPPVTALDRVLMKSKTFDLAEELGVPYPYRHLIDGEEALQRHLGSVSFPAVLKPVSSIAGDVQLSVDYAFDTGELERKGRNLLERSPFLLQQYVGGTGVGIELIANRGEIVYAFQHRRLHELPLSGGGSCYRESVAVDPELLEASRRLIRALGWHGVAMVEFKKDESRHGVFWLMEINGRFWGSLPLAVAAGADFPYFLYRLYTDDTGIGETAPARTGIRCRKLSADLMWYEQVLRGAGHPRLFQRPTNGMLLRQALEVFSLRHRFDVQSLSDPLPGLVDIYRIGAAQVSRITKIVRRRRLLRRLASPHERQRIRTLAQKARHVLFVCYGNINRSALAEAIAAGNGLPPEVEVQSAGFHPVAGRPADPVMQRIAREHDVDLTASRSTILEPELLQWADLVLVMEAPQLDMLNRIEPGAADKSGLLGSIAPESGQPEIPDPYGKPEEIYQACFRRIETAVVTLNDWIRGKQAT